ncbi:MAG TPA: UDP-glucose/GDP-mannose dehydrogenase family protein [Burkholderiales bacterium]|nr:UDP-glucose/GDP-mannose dehydrogenase family protein [Burkholderiales bacterium]
MKISIIGTGYVGLVSGACFADLGNNVMCLDLDAKKIARLKEGDIPIYEPGLEAMVKRNIAAGRLHFTTDVKESVTHGTVQFIAVGTPPGEDGSADLSYVLGAARDLGRYMNEYRVVVDKSTVPVGTAEKVRDVISEELARRGVKVDFSVVSNPEFLKEGAAVEDFMRPDRIVVGADDGRAVEIMRSIYAAIQRNHDRLIVMDIRSAELTKYAANAMLATRISFMNEIANLAERLGADIEHVRLGIGSDARIGYHFLYAGCGYGGSCFPKDLAALSRMAVEHGTSLHVLEAVSRVNHEQKQRLAEKVMERFGKDLKGKRFALWGLAFKPNTDDMREAPSVAIIDGLLKRGAAVSAYDPVAIGEAQKLYAGKPAVAFAEGPLAALDGCDALIIATEWKEFRSPDFDEIKKRLKQPVVFDGRNLYEPALVRIFGIEYHAIGRTNGDAVPARIKSR